VITLDLAHGVHRVAHGATNFYLVEDGDTVAFVDAGLPRSWGPATEVLRRTGHSWTDVKAIVLTHAHFDHVGFADRAHREFGVPVWVHEADAPLAAHPYRYQPGRPRLAYPLRHPRALPYLAAMVGAGALWAKGVSSVRTFSGGDALDVPGHLEVLATPGHTEGHVALHLAARGVVFSGDGLVTLDPYTGARGPRVVAQAGTQDGTAAVAALDELLRTQASVVLPGHGEPWTDGVASAVAAARRAGVA
jgi:glyoxylase-like metal-dependent hydrolase (beta-lactamase superfamily II)